MSTPTTRPSGVRSRRPNRPATALVAGLLVLGLSAAACTSSNDSAKTSDSMASSGSSGRAGVTQTYKNLDIGGPLTVAALKKGDIDVGQLFSVNGAIAANGWVTLEDDRKLQAADNFVPAIRTDKVTPGITAVLNAVDKDLTQSGVQELVKQVSDDGQNPADVAKDWLKKQNLPGDLKATGSLTVGALSFTEGEIMGEIYAQVLKSAGVDVTVRSGLGERPAYIPLLEKGDLDLIPEFTASLLVFLDANATPSGDLDTTYRAAKKAAEAKGFTLLKPSDVSDVNVFVVTKETADKYKLKTLTDLAKAGVALRWGVAPACADNAQCIPGLEKSYGFKFAAG